MQFHFHANQSHFHKNGFARALKQRYKGTRNWPILFSYELNAEFLCHLHHLYLGNITYNVANCEQVFQRKRAKKDY